jgi:hypothetical protein
LVYPSLWQKTPIPDKKSSDQPNLLFADAPEVLITTDEKLAVADGDGADDSLPKAVGGEEFEGGAGFEDEAVTALIGSVAFAIATEDE